MMHRVWVAILVFILPAVARGQVTYRIVAKSGEMLPEVGAGISFGSFTNPSISPDGAVGFGATLAGPSISFNNDGSLWYYPGASRQLLARDGDLGPGAPAGS